jgi:hypothetical protein
MLEPPFRRIVEPDQVYEEETDGEEAEEEEEETEEDM